LIILHHQFEPCRSLQAAPLNDITISRLGGLASHDCVRLHPMLGDLFALGRATRPSRSRIKQAKNRRNLNRSITLSRIDQI
jgi:hypothetical protein